MYDYDPVESTISPRPVHAEVLQTLDGCMHFSSTLEHPETETL
jgi:hypothetical protein